MTINNLYFRQCIVKRSEKIIKIKNIYDTDTRKAILSTKSKSGTIILIKMMFLLKSASLLDIVYSFGKWCKAKEKKLM